jgi:hypothetical protein
MNRAFVISAKGGIQAAFALLRRPFDPRFRGNDGIGA